MTDFKTVCSQIAESAWFGYFLIAVIGLNAVVLGLQTYPQYSPLAPLFDILTSIFLGIFSVEILVRIAAFEPEYARFFENKWNLFDFLVVALAFVPGIGSAITVVRLLRLLQTFRLVGRMKDLRTVVNSLIRSIPSVLSIILLMGIIMYIYGIVGYYLFHVVDPLHWGTLGRSILTLFTMITFEGWDIVMFKALSAFPNSWPFFVSFIIIGAMMIVNLFVSVILSNMMQVKKEESGEPEKLEKELSETRNALARIEAKLENLQTKPAK